MMLNASQNKTKFTILRLSSFLVFSFFIQAASAQTSTSNSPAGTSTVEIGTQAPQETKPFSIATYLEMSEKIAKEEVSSKENSVALQIAPAYKWNDLLTSTGEIVINKDNYGQRETTTSDLKIGLSIKGFQLSEEWKTKHSLGTVAPLNRDSVERDRLKGHLSISNGIEYKNTYFTTTYSLSLSQNFHEFTQNAEGSPNIQRRISQSLGLTVPVLEKLSLAASGLYRVSYTYNNFNRFSFGFDLDLNYDFTSNFAANIGTSNEGRALKSNGLDSNIAAYNENSSVVRAGMSYNY
jgi:hypothetical protein